MTTDNAAIVRRVLETFAARDLEALLELLDPEVVFAPLLGRVGDGEYPYCGHAGMRRYFDDMRRAWPDLEIVPTHIEQAGDAVVVIGTVTADATREQPLRASAVWTWKLRHGLVTEARVHADSGPARAALGLPQGA
ncbi:MAG: hypothetical protein NVS1B9_04400 [Solirubrobacteraceae bacterium]